MSESSNPTVAINVTEKELRVLMEAVPYTSPYAELRQKLNNAHIAMGVLKRIKNRERKAARKTKAKQGEHRPNGPYPPVGDLGGERCVECQTAWPCAAVLPGGSHHEHEDCCK